MVGVDLHLLLPREAIEPTRIPGVAQPEGDGRQVYCAAPGAVKSVCAATSCSRGARCS